MRTNTVYFPSVLYDYMVSFWTRSSRNFNPLVNGRVTLSCGKLTHLSSHVDEMKPLKNEIVIVYFCVFTYVERHNIARFLARYK